MVSKKFIAAYATICYNMDYKGTLNVLYIFKILLLIIKNYEKFSDGTVKCVEDEIPFEVPEGWEWCRIGAIFTTITGSTPSTKNSEFYGKEYPFYKPTDLDNGFYIEDSVDYVSEKGYICGRILPKYSVLVTCIGATIGKTGHIRKTGICNQQINAILPNENIISEFCYHFMCSEFAQNQIKNNASSTTLPILNKRRFDNFLLCSAICLLI